MLSYLPHIGQNDWPDCFQELYSFLSPYLKDFEAQRCPSFGTWAPIPKAKSYYHPYSTCEYESHQEECQARKPCNSGEHELYTPGLWWTVRQHYHCSSRDRYQDIRSSIYYVLSPQSFWFKVHISLNSIGRNSTKARRKWLVIPWQKGGDGVFDRGSLVIGGEKARKRSCFYNCCVKFYCFCLKLWNSVLYFSLYSVFVSFSMLL